jgi:hypothetical protein
MGRGARKVGRWVGLGLVITALSAAEAAAQYGPRSNPIMGVRTGGRYQPALASPFATSRAGLGIGGFGTSAGLSRYGGLYGPSYGGLYGSRLGGFYGPGFGVSRFGATSYRSGFGIGGVGLGVRSFGYRGVGFGAPVGTSFSLSIGGYPGLGFGYPGYGVGYPGYGYGYSGYGYGYGDSWLYGRSPYGTTGFNTISYGGLYPYGSIGYGGFPYGYGYGYRGGYFGY